MESSNELFIIDLSTFECTKPRYNEATGKRPPPVDNHTAVLYPKEGDEKMIIFGGYRGCWKSNDLFEYSLRENTWRQINPKGKKPPERSNQSACVFEDCMYIFGGIDDETNKLSDFWKFDFVKEEWIQLPTSEGISSPSVKYLKYSVGKVRTCG